MATKPYGNRHFEIGEFADDAELLTYIRARKWDHDGSGTGNPQEGMTYWNTTEKAWRRYSNSAWRTEQALIDTRYVTDAITDVGVVDNCAAFVTASSGLKTFNLPVAFNGGRYRFIRAAGYLKVAPNGSQKIFANGPFDGGWWEEIESFDQQSALVELMAIPGQGWFIIDAMGTLKCTETSTPKTKIFHYTASPLIPDRDNGNGIIYPGEKNLALSNSYALGTSIEMHANMVFGFGSENYNENNSEYAGILGIGGYNAWGNNLVIGGAPRKAVGGGDYAVGTKQGGKVVLKAQTDGVGDSATLETCGGVPDLRTREESTIQMYIMVTGRKASPTESVTACWEIKCGFEHRTSGGGGPVTLYKNISLLGRTAAAEIDDWGVDVDIDASGNIDITVSSNSGVVEWGGSADWLEVGEGFTYTPIS